MTMFAQRLKAMREKNGFTQAQLAKKIGVSSQTISAYEKNGTGGGGKSPTLDKAVDLASVLGVTMDYLCGIPSKESEIKNLADVAAIVEEINYTLDCKTSSERIPVEDLDFPDPRDIFEGNFYAVLRIADNDLAKFFEKRNKMQTLWEDHTIDMDLYKSWLAGEQSNLKELSLDRNLSITQLMNKFVEDDGDDEWSK